MVNFQTAFSARGYSWGGGSFFCPEQFSFLFFFTEYCKEYNVQALIFEGLIFDQDMRFIYPS